MFSKDVPPYDFFELTEFFNFVCSLDHLLINPPYDKK